MIPVFSRKSFLFLALGVFALLFGTMQSASAVQCVVSNPATPGTPVWNGSGTCDYPITYQDPTGGSALTTCQYQAINWNGSLDPAGWSPAVANPDSCTGDTALMKSGGIVIGSTGDCTLNGQDTCWLYWKAADNSGNSDSGLLKSFDIDYVGPTLTQVTAVPSPTSDTTPNYTFNSTEAGVITYGGDCSSATTSAVVGDNTVTFNTLASGVHNNCTVTVTDAIGNASLPLNVNSFTIDTTAPTITNVSSDKANGSYTVGEVIDIDVTFSEAVTSTGNVTVTLETGTIDRTCVFTVSGAVTGTCNYTVQVGDTSADLTVASISGTIKDVALNTMTNFVPTTNLAANKAIVIDTIAPTVTAFSINSNSCTGAGCPVTVLDKDALDIQWTAPDNVGGSGVWKHEIWRTQDINNWPGTPQVANATSPYTAENPAEGTYWYGIHTLDNATNCITETAVHCGGTSSDSESRTVRGPIKVVMDKTAPVTSVTSVAGDMSSPYWDTTNNSSTDIVISGEANMLCRWGDTDAVYSSMPSGNSCPVSGSTATCSLSLPQLASYTKHVSCKDAAGNEQAISQNLNVTLGVDWTAPSDPGTTPSATSPTNNTRPTWSWSAFTDSVSGVASYDVQWATNPAFTQNLGNGSSGINSFTHSSPLAENTWHFHVKARDAAGNESGFSGSGTVVIDTTPPGTPNLISPSGTISTTTPTFNWNTISDPSGVTYTLWVDNNSNFGSLEINQSGLASSSYTPGGGILIDGTTYYWKVRAVDGAGNTGNFPAHNTFTVVLNQPSANPTSPLQFKNDGSTSISNQGFTNETTVKLRASATDADTSEVIRLFFEVALNSGSFASPATPTTGTSCTSGTLWSSCANKIWYISSSSGNYSSTPFTGTTSVVGLSTGTGYKWQVKACDDSGACSGWVAFNAVRPNFSVDTATPVVSFFAITPDSSVSPNWTRTNVLISWNDPGAGTGITDPGGSGLNRIEVWRAWDANGNGTLQSPSEWNDSSPLPGTQANPIYTKDSGFTSSTSDDGSYPDSPPTGTYWYGLHVLDNAGSIGYEPSTKKALMDKDEPTATINAPVADLWLHSSAQQRSFLKTTDEDLYSDINPSACTFEVCSYEPDGTEHCKGTEDRACDITTNTEEIFVGLSAAHCDYQGWGACVIFVQAADLAGNATESSQEYNVDWEFPSVGKLYVTPTEAAQTYPIHVQQDAPTTYKVHTTDTVGFSYCDLYIDSVKEQGPVVPIGCTTDCTIEFEGVVLPDPGGDHTYTNNYAVCYDASVQGSQGTAENIVVETLMVSLSAVPSPGGSTNTLFDLTADTAGSTMTGDTTYGFDCRIDTGDCTADGNFADCDLSITTPTGVTSYTADNLCQYPVTAGTYTAKVAVQRGVGTAQDTVAIGPITTNSDPTTTVRSVDTPNATDYCGVTGFPPVRVRWTFSDADPGDTQDAYELRIVRVSDGFTIDTGKKTGTTQEYVFQSAGEQLLWGTSYTWQVKVWDNHDAASAFIAGPGFTTIAHYYPVPNFTWSPSFPSAEELIQFTDLTNFAPGATGKTWSWDFDNSNGIQTDSSMQNPTHTYAQTKAYGVTLQATDNVGSCPSSQSVNVAVPFPEWQEISPF